MKTNLKGLLLVGGKSSRMGSDKAHIVYRDQPEWQRISAIMEKFCSEVFLCCREEQSQEFKYPTIIDSGDGVLAAIAAADVAFPGSSWMVVACDLPLLDDETVEILTQSRVSNTFGTHYISAVDGKPEPLCSIYESAFFEHIKSALKQNQYCPRNLILDHSATLIPLANSVALKNANTPAEKLEIEGFLNDSRVEKIVTIRYFAQLKEIVTKESESVKTLSVTPAGLYEELQTKYKFPHKPKQLMIAINDDFSDWDTRLNDGDEIVFIPPVAGG